MYHTGCPTPCCCRRLRDTRYRRRRRYAEASRRAGLADKQDPDASAAAKLVAGLEVLNKELSVPSPAAYGIDERVWNEKMELMAEQALASGSPANNPRVPDKAEIAALYREVWTGAPRNV
jgi:alcohol dehydrogenase class IV